MGQWLGPLIAAAVIAAILGAIVITTGIINLSADIPHPQGWAELLHYSFKRSVSAHADDIMQPADLGTMPIAKGAMMFDAVCANCHSAPGRGQSLVSLSMRPQPQYLPLVINQYTPAELFWIVKHGVKYSAMPSFPTQARDDEIWSVVAFLRALPTMDAASYRATTMPVKAPAATGGALPIAAAATPVPAGFRGEHNAAVPAIGFGGQRLGGDIASHCIGCHGGGGLAPRGEGIPKLGLLNPETIRAALTGFASGERKSGYMQPIAAQLSPVQIDALAMRLGNDRSTAAAPEAPAPHNAALLQRGEQIANNGLPEKRVTACQECHDISRATRKFYPAIAGQDRRYLRDQMRLYRAGVRNAGAPVQPMQAETHKLSDGDIDAVAVWYAARAPEAPAPVQTGPGGVRVPLVTPAPVRLPAATKAIS